MTGAGQGERQGLPLRDGEQLHPLPAPGRAGPPGHPLDAAVALVHLLHLLLLLPGLGVAVQLLVVQQGRLQLQLLVQHLLEGAQLQVDWSLRLLPALIKPNLKHT